jgi:hypothetical protein
LEAVAGSRGCGRCQRAALDLVDQLGQQLGRGRRVAHIARGGSGRHHQLAVGVDRGMALVAVKAAGAGLVAMAGIGVDGGDHPVGGDLTRDPEAAVRGLLQVLAGHRGQQPHGLSHRRGERAAGSTPSSA